MKKLLAALLCACLLLSLCACSGQGETVPAQTPAVSDPSAPAASPSSAPATPSAEEQILLLLARRSEWDCTDEEFTEYDRFSYAVTDLDHNGRLELFAARTQGSGVFTEGKLFEVSADFSALAPCTFVYDDGTECWDLPEVIINSVQTFTDAASGLTQYIFLNTTKVGVTNDGAIESGTSMNALSLRDGVVTVSRLGYLHALYYTESSDIRYYDAADNEITEAQYQSLAVDTFSSLTESSTQFGWFTFNDGAAEELLPLSWQVFSGALDAMPAPETTPAPIPTAEPAASVPIGENGNIRVTKNPTSESLSVGGQTWFIAHADNATSIDWQFISPDGAVHSVDETASLNPGLSLEVLEGDTLGVSNVPLSFDGWSVQAVFSDGSSSAATSPAPIYVGDFVAAYASVIENYKKAYESGMPSEGNALQLGVSEWCAYNSGAGYAFKDLDKDGTPELIVAGTGGSPDDMIVFEIDTLKGGAVAQLCISSARDRYYLRTDNNVLNEGSSGAAYTAYYLLQLGDGSFTPLDELRSDVDENGQAYWHHTEYYVSNDEQKLSDDEGLALAASYKASLFLPPLTAIK